MTTTTNEPRNVEAELAKGFKARLGRIIDNAKAMERDLGDQSDPAANEWAACRLYVEEDQEALASAAVAGVLSTVERFVEESEHRRRVLLRLLDKYPDRLPWPKEVLRRIAPRTALPRSFPALRQLLSIDPVDEWKPFAFAPDLSPLECVRWGFEHLGIPGTPDVALLDATIQQPGLLHDREADTHTTDQSLAGSHRLAGLHHATIALVAHAAMLETVEAIAKEAAREILDEAKKENDKLAHEEHALNRLELATWEHLVKVRKAIGLPLSVDEMRALGGRDGLYELDARLVPELQRIGDAGKKGADAVKGKVAPNWARWADDRLRLPRLLARALWHDVLRPLFEREAERGDTAGLPMPVLTSLVAVSRRGAQQTLPLLGVSGQDAEILDHRGRRVGSLRLSPLIALRHVKLAALGRLSTQRLVRHLLWQGYERKWINDAPSPERIIVDGGYRELAFILGMSGNKAIDEVKEAVATLAAIHINTPTGEGQVFAYHHNKSHPGQAARLEMVLLGPFAPDYIARELSSHRKASDKYLVPVPMPRLLPPLVGRANEHAAQAHLQVLALREFRVHAVEMKETGGVEIEQKKWRELADEAGLPRSLLPTVLDAYPKGDGERPAFLERPSEWSFALTDSYERERDSILSAARAQQAGAEGGRKSARKRRQGGRGPRRGKA